MQVAPDQDGEQVAQPSSTPNSAALRRARRTLLILVLIFVLASLNGVYPVLLFARHWLNWVFSLVVLLLPWAGLLVVIRRPVVKRLWVRLVLGIALAAAGTVMVLFEAVNILMPEGVEVRGIATMEGYRVSLYRLNCGAPCDFSMEVMQEKALIPPLLLVRRLDLFDPAYDAECAVLGKNHLRVTALSYDRQSPDQPKRNTREYHLKRFLYF